MGKNDIRIDLIKIKSEYTECFFVIYDYMDIGPTIFNCRWSYSEQCSRKRNQMIDKMLNLVRTRSIQLWRRLENYKHCPFWIPVFLTKLRVVLMYRYSIEKPPSDGNSNIAYHIRVLWMLEESLRRPTCWRRGVRPSLWFTLSLHWRQAVNSALEAKTHMRLCPSTAANSKQSNVHH